MKSYVAQFTSAEDGLMMGCPKLQKVKELGIDFPDVVELISRYQ